VTCQAMSDRPSLEVEKFKGLKKQFAELDNKNKKLERDFEATDKRMQTAEKERQAGE